MDAIDKIIDATARTESGGKYDSWNPDDAGAGVSFGLIQFNQKKGGLPHLFKRMNANSTSKFAAVFGEYASGFLDETWVRTADLNAPHLKELMLRAAQEPEFQQAQRDVAREMYFAPAQALANKHGLKSERALAMLFDAYVQRAPKTITNAMNRALATGGDEKEILRKFSLEVDEGTGPRRQKIFASANFSDSPPGGGAGKALLLGILGIIIFKMRQ